MLTRSERLIIVLMKEMIYQYTTIIKEVYSAAAQKPTQTVAKFKIKSQLLCLKGLFFPGCQ